MIENRLSATVHVGLDVPAASIRLGAVSRLAAGRAHAATRFGRGRARGAALAAGALLLSTSRRSGIWSVRVRPLALTGYATAIA